MNRQRILIIDDEITVVTHLQTVLENLGYLVNTTIHPLFYQKIIDSFHPDLILLDVHMPKLDGIQLLKQMKSQKGLERIPVLMLTGESREETLQLCFETGACDYILKPVSTTVLKARVEGALKTRNILESMRKFISVVSHDLRSPIGAIRGLCEILLEKNSCEITRTLHSSSLRCQELIDNLLGMMAFEDGRILLNKKKFYIHDLLSECLSEVEVFASSKQIKICLFTHDSPFLEESLQLKNFLSCNGCHLASGLFDTQKTTQPNSASERILSEQGCELSGKNFWRQNIEYENNSSLIVFADFTRIRQVICNLLINAIKFSFKNTNIILYAKQEGDQVRIGVRDFGVGIDEEKKNKLFSWHERTSSPGTNQESGTGYGLPLCQELILAHNSRIEVCSTPDHGSDFSFLLTLFKESS